jgi:hypothetical protein
MQKSLFAAAIATGASALKLEANTNTLAQSAGNNECHGTYAYQCIEEKVEASQAAMSGRIEAQKQECLSVAEAQKDGAIERVQRLRYELEKNLLWDMRENQTEALNNRLDEALAAIENAAATAEANMRAEADGRINDTSDISGIRIRAQNDIKKLYYRDGNGDEGAEGLKAQIREVMDQFAADSQGASFADFAGAERDAADATITAECDAMDAAIKDALSAWNDAAGRAEADFGQEIADRIADLDATIARHTADMNADIDELQEDYIVIFWNTIEEIYSAVSYYERQGLIWKALYGKDAFMAEVNGIRDWMRKGLAQTRKELVDSLGAERAGFAANTAENRDGFFADTQVMRAELLKAKTEARASMDATRDDLLALLDSKHKNDENGSLESFVYDLASIGYSPKGFGSGHAAGYQPYGKQVAYAIQEQIDVFGDDAAAAFQNVIDNETAKLNALLANEKAALHEDNWTLQDDLNATGARLLAEIQAERERLELSLTNWQNAQENTDEESRDVDQIALVTTKNNLWKDLSWIVRKTLAGAGQGGRGGGHEHGLSAGPVYSYNPGFLAQTGSDGLGASVSFDSDYSEQVGFGAEGPEDGYDPFGYGDWGWGYGYQQQQYKEIAAVLQKMTAAQELIVAQNEARIAASQAGLDAVQGEAWDQWSATLDARWAEWNDAVDTQNATWAQIKADRTATVDQGIADAQTAFQTALDAKIAEFDRMEKEIRWHITSIYNYDHQHALNEALTAARAEQDAICDERQAAWAAYILDVEATWDACLDSESASLDANTAAATATLQEGKATEAALFEEFKRAQQERFAAWAADERAAIAQWVADCQEAWEWIQVSYCLRHGADGEVQGAGHGCSWGNGAGYGNAGYLKGVAVEEHDAILSYGQDLDIKHIHNEGGLVAAATEWTMQGVEEEFQRQANNVDEEQAAREAGVEAAKQALRDALNGRLAASVASLDATVERLAQELADREDGALAGVESTRAGWEQEIDDERARILWAIKELVWKLGYAQGYVYGAHDGHDAELLQAITDLKEEYEAAIVARLEAMQNRVAAEQADGDEANAAAWAELQGEFDRLRAEMRQAVGDALAACEQILADARAAQEASIGAATDALYAFIDGRLAAWAAQHAQESANAQWQEDSYYRYNLLRLLQAKQQSIDDAVAAVKARWAAAMAEERAQGMAFRGDQRTAFRGFTEATTAALEAAIAEDDANMADIVAEREASLDTRLDEQQTAFEDAVEADRAEMRRALKEVYNYNTYEFTPSAPKDHISAPYSHEQHRAFLNKFAYYMKDVLARRDAQNAADANEYAGEIAAKTEAADEQNEDLSRAIQDQADASEKACNRHADNLLETYAETQALALEMLRDWRDAEEATALSEKEGFANQVIYAMHILRYAGGRDSGSFGFGNAPSSYYGKGNSLTGIDTLDNYRLPSTYGYAQVGEVGAPILKLNDDEENRDRQEASLEDAKLGFDAMVQACRDRFGDRTADEQSASAAAMEQLNADLEYATSGAQAGLAQAIADAEAALAGANDDRQAWLQALTDERLGAFFDVIDAEKGKVNAWFDDQKEWAEKLYDSYYKESLLATLANKRDSTLAALDASANQAAQNADVANAQLADQLNAIEANNADFNARTLANLTAVNDQLQSDSAATAAQINGQFSADAAAENDGKNAFLDQLTEDWGYWLRYAWGYSGYDTAFYNNYDDTKDYSLGSGNGSDTKKYAGADGAYLGLGYQGASGNGGTYGAPHLSGFGYGGVGGHDYLYAGDSQGLAYGPHSGPDKRYFSDSILDPAEDLSVLLDGYASSYGKRYW